jgi:hypothetical protein
LIIKGCFWINWVKVSERECFDADRTVELCEFWNIEW